MSQNTFFRCNLTLGRCYPNNNDNKYFAGVPKGEPPHLIVLRTSAVDIGTYGSVGCQNCHKKNTFKFSCSLLYQGEQIIHKNTSLRITGGNTFYYFIINTRGIISDIFPEQTDSSYTKSSSGLYEPPDTLVYAIYSLVLINSICWTCYI